MKPKISRSVVMGLGVAVVVALGVGSASARDDYKPPSHLGGHGRGSGPDQFFTDPTDTLGTGEPLEDDLTNYKDMNFPDGLSNVRVFPGGKDAARYFFNRAVWAAINAVGNDPPNAGNNWTSPTEQHLKIYGLAKDPDTGPGVTDNVVCAVRFDVDNRIDPPDVTQEDKEVWNPTSTGLLAIFYNEHAATHLSWIEFVFRRPGRIATGLPPVHKVLSPTNVHSHRIIFLERKSDSTLPKDYYGYDTPPPSQLSYPVYPGNKGPHRLICDVKPDQPAAPTDLTGTSHTREDGGGGGEM